MNRTIATPSKAVFLAHQVYNSTTGLLPTAATDMNSNNRFYGNTLTNCITAVYIGGTTSANDTGNDIGGTSVATGNTMNNVIGALYSSVGAVTCTYQTNCNISYNTINNTAGGGTNAIATAWGIYAYGPSSVYTVNNNNITLTEAAISTAYAIYGIYGNAASPNITANNNIVSVSELAGSSAVNNIAIFLPNGNNTTISNNTVTQSMAVSSTTYGIYITSTGAAVINGNTLKQTSSAATGSQFYSIVSGGTGTSETIQNNIFDNSNVSVAGTLGYMALIFTVNSTGNKIISGNTINGTITHNSSSDFYGILDNPGSAPAAGVASYSNNNFSNISKSGSGGVYAIYTAPTVATSRHTHIEGNTISNITHAGTGLATGIFYASGNNDSIYNNRISDITGGGTVYGMYGSSPATVNAKIYKNKIYALSTTGANNSALGITIADGTTINLFNNYIGDIRASTSTGAGEAVKGINILSTTANSKVNVYYNSIYLNASSSGANFSTAGIYHTASATATTAELDMRNNIIVNTSTPSGTGATVAYRRSGTALNNYNSNSNNNLFYAGAPSASNLIMRDGTNSYQTLATYQAAVSTRDAVSITEIPNFLSTTGSAANFLHIGVSAATAIESGGAAIAGYTDDYDGDIRQGNPGYTGGGTAPDIGADEFNLCSAVTYTTQPPATVAGCINSTVSISIVAANATLYQWQENTGSGFVNITNGGIYSGATTSTLTLTGVTAGMSGYTYRCLARYNAICPQIASNITTFTINPTANVNAVSNQTVCNSSTVNIPFTGSVSGTTFNWSNSNTAIGLGASGSGDLNFTSANTTTAPISATITVTPTNASCAPGAPITFTITVNPTATVNAVTNQTVCNGSPTTAVTFGTTATGGTVVYNWTNNTTSIGLAASGTGNIASFNGTNTTTAPVTATITVTPSYTNNSVTCTGTPRTFTITVNPTATVNAITNQTVCNGSPTTAVTFGTTATGGTVVYNWTNNTTSIGLAASGTGNIASFNGANTTTAPVTATITVTPSYTNNSVTCTGTPRTFTITVNPTATVTAVANQTVCNGSPTTAVTFGSPTTGGTIVYNWTNNTPAIGLAASGSGNIASFNATNTTNAPLVATITVTPSYTNGVTCSGTASTFTITVNPTATVNTVTNQTVCHNALTAAISFSSPSTGGTIVYNWVNNTPSIGLAASGAGNIAAFTAINTGTTPVTATITVTPSYTNGSVTCTGTAQTFTITVNTVSTAPTGITTSAAVVCGSGTVTLTAAGGTLGTGAQYKWYTGTCGGTPAGSGPSITVPVYSTTTFFVRIEGTCNTTTCASLAITAAPQPVVVNTAIYSTNSSPYTPVSMYASVSPVGNYTYQWQRNGTNIPGAVHDTLRIPVSEANGSYTVTVVYAGTSCSAVSNAITVTDAPLTRIFIMPNPNSGIFRVYAYANSGDYGSKRSLIVVDGKGARVYSKEYTVSQPYNQLDVDISQHAKGIYHIAVINGSGKVLASGEVMKQ